MPKPQKPSKKNTVRVNFKDVEVRAKIPDGQYRAAVAEITSEDGTQAKYLKWVWEIQDEQFQGRKVFYNTSLAPQALWNLRNLLETLGVETPDAETDLDLDSFVGLEAILRIENEVWEGKERPKVSDFTPIDAAAVDDEAPAAAAGAPADTEGDGEGTEGEGDDKVSESEIREMDEKQLQELVKDYGLKVDLSKLTRLGKKMSAVIDAMEVKGLLRD